MGASSAVVSASALASAYLDLKPDDFVLATLICISGALMVMERCGIPRRGPITGRVIDLVFLGVWAAFAAAAGTCVAVQAVWACVLDDGCAPIGMAYATLWCGLLPVAFCWAPWALMLANALPSQWRWAALSLCFWPSPQSLDHARAGVCAPGLRIVGVRVLPVCVFLASAAPSRCPAVQWPVVLFLCGAIGCSTRWGVLFLASSMQVRK